MTSEVGKIRSPTMMGAVGKMAGKERSPAPQTTSTTPRMRMTKPIVTITMENTDSPMRRSKKSRSMSQP